MDGLDGLNGLDGKEEKRKKRKENRKEKKKGENEKMKKKGENEKMKKKMVEKNKKNGGKQVCWFIKAEFLSVLAKICCFLGCKCASPSWYSTNGSRPYFLWNLLPLKIG